MNLILRTLLSILLFSSFLIWPYNFYNENINRDRSSDTIFKSDHQARQAMLRSSNLYPNVFLARFFNNKVLVVTKKYLENIFTFLDPNYYFFASHPREVINGQNYLRQVFLTFPFFIYGLYQLINLRKYFAILISSILVLTLSLMSRPEQYDLLIWPFVSYFIYFGFKKIV